MTPQARPPQASPSPRDRTEDARAARSAATAAAAITAEAARARVTYGTTTTTSIPPGIFIASPDTILYSNQRFVFVVTQSLVNSGVATHSNLGTVFDIKATRRQSVQAQIPPGWRQALTLTSVLTLTQAVDREPWFLPEPSLFDVPKSELSRAVVLEQELSPGYKTAVGMHAFLDATPLSTAVTDEHMWVRGRLAEKFLQGEAHGLLLAPRHVSDVQQIPGPSAEAAPLQPIAGPSAAAALLPPAPPYVSDLERRKGRERALWGRRSSSILFRLPLLPPRLGPRALWGQCSCMPQFSLPSLPPSLGPRALWGPHSCLPQIMHLALQKRLQSRNMPTFRRTSSVRRCRVSQPSNSSLSPNASPSWNSSVNSSVHPRTRMSAKAG